METTYPKVSKIYWHLLVLLALGTVLTGIATLALRPDYRLKVSVFDIGQGDAIFITSAYSTHVLIDGGPNSGVLQKLGKVMPFFDRTIDLVILTHPHADHMTGLIDVLARYKVKNVLLTEIQASSRTFEKFQEVLKKENANIIIARAGQNVWLDRLTVLKILAPKESLAGKNIDDLNETSVVGRLSYGKIDFLMMGDTPSENELQLVNSGLPLASEVLKVGHHGSRYSTSNVFLDAVKPGLAVISVGEKNRYGHPHQETLNRLIEANIKILRTDKDGDIRMVSDGESLLVE